MAGTVSQYQQGAFSDLSNGTIADATVVLSNDNATRGKHNSHDADATIHVQSSLAVNRPAAATAQRLWLSTDTGGVFLALDTGAAWVDINYIRTTATSLPASVLASSLTSVGVLAAPHMTAPVVDSGGMTITAGTLAAQAVTATTIHGTGAATFDALVAVTAGGITVSAGTSAFQAVTATTGNFSGNVSVGGGSIASQPLGVHVATNLNLYVYNKSGVTLQTGNDAFNANIAMAFAASSFEFRIGSVVFDSAFACNGATAQAKQVSGGTLAGVIAALVANGILSS